MSQAACGLQASSGVKHEPLKATRRTPFGQPAAVCVATASAMAFQSARSTP